MHKQPLCWYLYIIRAKNQHLYTGITTDVMRRLAMHENGKGAKFLRGKDPLQLIYSIEVGDKSTAMKLEYAIKQLSKQQKERLVTQKPKLNELLVLIATKSDQMALNS